jgi:hypothetical protein
LSGPKGEVSAGVHHRLASVVPHELADGHVHTVRIVYYRFINYDYLPYFTGSSYLQQYLKDNGEVRMQYMPVLPALGKEVYVLFPSQGLRIGTLVVFVDDMAVPLVAFPINLSVAMALPEGLAYAV